MTRTNTDSKISEGDRTASSDSPLVTVVVTTYYRNERLREALDSIVRQEYSPVETVVVDGSGERHAEPVVNQYEVAYVAQEADEGVQAARSLGAEWASGAYVNFLDDDDKLHPQKLRKQLSLIQKRDDVGVVYCGKTTEDGQRMMPDPNVRGDVLEYALKFEMTPSSPSTMLIEYDVLEQILPLVNRHGADDMGMKIELAQRTAFDFLDEALVTIGASEDSLGGSMENIEGRKEIFDRYDELYDDFPPSVRRTAVAYTCLLEAEVILNQQVWSFEAIRKAVRANYLFAEPKLSSLGYAVATLGGRPGRDFCRKVFLELFVGDTNRGKLV